MRCGPMGGGGKKGKGLEYGIWNIFKRGHVDSD